ncbi:MAG: PASTA domain-containing protein [Sedimentisphaerales bacterium]|nr:PASTA domain-containing protein [Sedimentisphaerales bacterium]
MGKTTNLPWMCVLVLALACTASGDESISRWWFGTLDIPGHGGEVTQYLEFSGAPANAYVTTVNFWVVVDDQGNEGNFWCSDYEIYVGNDTRGAWYRCLWNHEGGKTDGGADDDSPDDSDISLLCVELNTEFDGDAVNQKWYVAVRDNRIHGSMALGLGRLTRFEVQILYHVPKPDLTFAGAHSVSPSTVVAGEPGQTLELRCNIDNSGDGDAGPFKLSVYLYDSTPPNPEYHLCDEMYDGVAAGRAQERGFSCVFPVAVPPGEYWVSWRIDPDNNIDESDEINNRGETYPFRVLVRVPNVVGMSESQAVSAITSAELSVERGYRCMNDVAAGTVGSQYPEAGWVVAPGWPVGLDISSGPCLSHIPNVVGMNESEAVSAITSAGFVVGTKWYTESDTVPARSVVSQEPAAGSQALYGSAIELTISTGPATSPKIAVPNVVGMTQAAAQSTITSAGLVVGTVSSAPSDTATPGEVLSQNPTAGTFVPQGSAVDLVVCADAPPVGPAPGAAVAQWKLDETSGSIAHDSTGRYDGILRGNPLWLPDGGTIGGALDFDGLDDYVEIGDHADFDLTEQISVAAWIRVGAFDKPWQAIVGKGDSAWRIQRDNLRNAIEFACTGVAVQGAMHQIFGDVSVNDGQWHHVAGVYDGSKMSLYVDGVLDTSSPASGAIATNSYAVTIGENSEPRGRYWAGQIDDVRVYESALSESDIQAVMAGAAAQPASGGPTAGPVAHWKLDETEGPIALDSAGNNDGVLYGNPVWLPDGGMIDGALEFDGMDDYANCGNDPVFDITDRITLTTWIKVGLFDTAWQAIVTKGDSAWRIQRSGYYNGIEFACTGLSVPGTPHGHVLGQVNVNDGQWHHLAGVYDGSGLYLYVDGLLDVVAPASGSIATNAFDVCIADNAQAPGCHWNGLIDDVRVYDQALSQTQIKAVMVSGMAEPTNGGPGTTGLVAHWAFDESAGRVALDSVGECDGFLIGGPLWQADAGKVGGALDFDGSNDVVVTDFVLNPADGPLSVFAWIRGGGPGQVVLSQDGSQGGLDWLAADPSGRLVTRLGGAGTGRFGASLSSTTVVADGRWHEVGFASDGTKRTLYVDGVAVASDTQPALSGSTGGLNIGAGKDLDAGTYWSGLIDDVRIYDQAVQP